MPERHLTKKWLVASVIILSLVTVGFLAVYWFYSLSSLGWGSCTPELSIDTSYNGTTKTLDLNITSWVDKTITFQQLVIKDSKNQIFESTLPSVELQPRERVSISTNIGETELDQGNDYRIELLSSSGQKYGGILILFEWIQVTNVTYNPPRTLLVEISSPGGQTLVISHATVYDSQYKKATEGTVSPNRILPNQKVTVTVNI